MHADTLTNCDLKPSILYTHKLRHCLPQSHYSKQPKANVTRLATANRSRVSIPFVGSNGISIRGGVAKKLFPEAVLLGSGVWIP